MSVFDHSFIASYSTPLEAMTRQTQKLVHKGLSDANKNMTKTSLSSTPESAIANCDAAIAQLQTLRDKVVVHRNNAMTQKRRLADRLEYMQSTSNVDLVETTLSSHMEDEEAHDETQVSEAKQREQKHMEPETNLSSQTSMLMQRAMVDHLVRTDCTETADLLTKQMNMKSLVDTDMFTMAGKVVADLRAHSVKVALKWCGQSRSRLAKIGNTTFEFYLRLQEFVTMIQSGVQGSECIDYAQKYLVLLAKDDMKSELQQCMGLLILAGGANLAVPIGLEKYVASERWIFLIDEFRACYLQVHKLNRYSLLDIYIQVGLTALKTHSCQCVAAHSSRPTLAKNKKKNKKKKDSNIRIHARFIRPQLMENNSVEAMSSSNNNSDIETFPGLGDIDTTQPMSDVDAEMNTGNISNEEEKRTYQVHTRTENGRIVQCPVCQPFFFDIAAALPVCNAKHSRLICRLSGEPMNDDNPPFALPNGSVYGRRALEEMASSLNGIVICPLAARLGRTPASFQFQDCTRVYIM